MIYFCFVYLTHCNTSGFRCDDKWQGLNCSEPVSPLPTYLYDSFDPDINGSQWLKVVGAQTLPPCKVMAAGNALHFSGVRYSANLFAKILHIICSVTIL